MHTYAVTISANIAVDFYEVPEYAPLTDELRLEAARTAALEAQLDDAGTLYFIADDGTNGHWDADDDEGLALTYCTWQAFDSDVEALERNSPHPKEGKTMRKQDISTATCSASPTNWRPTSQVSKRQSR